MNGHSPRALVHTSLLRALSCFLLSVVLLCALLTGLLTATGGAAHAAGGYTPPVGVTTSNPLGERPERRAILGMLIRSIDSTPSGAQIRVASWNIRSDDLVDALVRAHQRKVRVKVIVDIGNANAKNPNDGVDRLQAELKGRRSSVERCIGSCRGASGIPHTKFFLFSRVGRAQKVIINTSANATDLAASSQWNDAYVVRNKKALYNAFRRNFEEMRLDTPVAQGYQVAKEGRVTAMFYPFTGAKATKDPVLRELDRVACLNADGSRVTKIRIAMTSWYGDRGIAIAHKVRELTNAGCDVRIVYAVAGNEALRVLRRLGPAPVPMQQVVQDFDGDGVYDRYLHSKVLTIKGTYRQRQTALVLNGSANWSPKVLESDEAVLKVQGKSLVRKYNQWIDGLYDAPPTNAPLLLSRRSTYGPVDPYSKIEVD